MTYFLKFIKYVCIYDIIMLTETWMTKDFLCNECSFFNVDLHDSSNKKKKGINLNHTSSIWRPSIWLKSILNFIVFYR